MTLRLSILALAGFTFFASGAAAQETGGAETGAAVDTAGGEAAADVAAAPEAVAQDEPPATSTSGTTSTTTSGTTSTTSGTTSGTAGTAGGGATAPGDTWGTEPAPVIHEPVGTSSPQTGAAAASAQPQEEDDGRGSDFLWLEFGFGYSWADLAAFSNQNFVPGVDQLKGSGYGGHVAAGFKLFLLTLGARGSVASYPGAGAQFDLWSLMFDAMLRIPIFMFEPYIRAGIGYAWMGQIDFNAPGASEISVYGLTIEAGFGLDVYLGKFVSIGAGLDLAFLNLTRQRLDTCMDVGGAMCDIGGVDLQEEGDAVGFQARATGHIAFHF